MRMNGFGIPWRHGRCPAAPPPPCLTARDLSYKLPVFVDADPIFGPGAHVGPASGPLRAPMVLSQHRGERERRRSMTLRVPDEVR